MRREFVLHVGSFAASPSTSIDYAVMERTSRAAVLPVAFTWDDMGTWTSIWNMSVRDEQQNAIIGDAELMEVSDSLVHTDGPLVAALGVKDLIVAATKDAVLVADRNRAQDVKDLVTRLELAGHSEVDDLPIVYRPWGSYQQVDEGHR